MRRSPEPRGDELGRDGHGRGRALVAVEAGEGERGALLAELPRVGADDGGAEQVGELEVVEAGERDRARRAGERVQGADRVAVVGGEQRGRAAALGQVEQAGDGGLGGGDVAVAGLQQRRVLLDARRLRAPRGSR